MKKRYVIALEVTNVGGGDRYAVLKTPYPLIEMAVPEKAFETFEEAEQAVGRMLSSPENEKCKFIILTQYSKG